MLPYITVFGRDFSMYGIMIAVGIIACLICCVLTAKKWKESEGSMELLILVSCLGAFVGSKIFYLITVWSQFTSDFSYLFTDPILFLTTYIGSGFVFYGGFYGAIIFAWIFCHFNHMNIWNVSQALMPCVPLFHTFGRIGCFFAGCCYGIEAEGFGITFTNSQIAPNNVPLFPVQLIEAFCELVLFIVLWRMSLKEDNGIKMFAVWLIAYGCARFILEMFRGDDYRGFWGIFSVSQLFAIFSVMLGIFAIIEERNGGIMTRRNRHRGRISYRRLGNRKSL